jgi:broad specificity phosphatase PhoE
MSTASSSTPKTPTALAGAVRPSIAVRWIRHAESRNNQVYRDARVRYGGGTPDFDVQGWQTYVDTHRTADPGLSDPCGNAQADCLADYLVPHWTEQASRPVRIVVSPMRRTLDTFRPTCQRMELANPGSTQVLVHGFLFESEGCHDRGLPREGDSPLEIAERWQATDDDDDNKHNNRSDNTPSQPLDFTGFPDPDRGWYVHGQGPETRAASEQRAAKFYLWLNEYLDQQLLESANDNDTEQPQQQHHDVFDAGVAIPGEEDEVDHDKFAPRVRRRRTVVLVGHGDFMSLVLKRIVAGYGHYVENDGIPHRSAFCHYNTGMTELEYFGHGRFLVMTHNTVPHLQNTPELLSGGSLKDGWSYLMPNDQFVLDAEVNVAFADELEPHIHEQAQALRALYRSDHPLAGNTYIHDDGTADNDTVTHFVVQRGLQVVGVATHSAATGRLTDVAVRPSAGPHARTKLFHAVQQYARQQGQSMALTVVPCNAENHGFFQDAGFQAIPTDGRILILADRGDILADEKSQQPLDATTK